MAGSSFDGLKFLAETITKADSSSASNLKEGLVFIHRRNNSSWMNPNLFMRLNIVMRNRVNGVLEEPEIDDLDDEDFYDDDW